MSSLYKREGSPYYWWTAHFKGRRLRKSTKLSQKHLAKKVQIQWDLNLVLGDLTFLGKSILSSTNVDRYIYEYLKFIEGRKTDKWLTANKTALSKFLEFLSEKKITRLDDINVKLIDGFLDWLNCAPKTKKNYLQIVSLMLDQTVKEGVLQANPARNATAPEIEQRIIYRPLESIDLEIIFTGAGSWYLYYFFLLHTGLRAGDVALLTYGNIDRKKKAIVSFVRKSRRIHEFPLAQVLIDQLPEGSYKDEPLFPTIYADNERKLKDSLSKPRKYMQTLLAKADPPRPKATLHSFRVTFNNTLRDLGLSIEDRQILLAHSSSETTKIYTHPNFELAQKYVNRLPDLLTWTKSDKMSESV